MNVGVKRQSFSIKSGVSFIFHGDEVVATSGRLPAVDKQDLSELQLCSSIA